MTEIEKELKKIEKKLLLESILHSVVVNYNIELFNVAIKLGLQVKVSNEMEPELKGFIKQLPDGSVAICINGKIDSYQQKYVVANGLLVYLSDRDIREGVLFY